MIRRPPRSTLFPYRRSSDLLPEAVIAVGQQLVLDEEPLEGVHDEVLAVPQIDRKSTRLNSSHGYISYAVFCLENKRNHAPDARRGPGLALLRILQQRRNPQL